MALPSCLFVLAALFGKSKKVHFSHRKSKYCEVKVDFDEVKVGSSLERRPKMLFSSSETHYFSQAPGPAIGGYP